MPGSTRVAHAPEGGPRVHAGTTSTARVLITRAYGMNSHSVAMAPARWGRARALAHCQPTPHHHPNTGDITEGTTTKNRPLQRAHHRLHLVRRAFITRARHMHLAQHIIRRPLLPPHRPHYFRPHHHRPRRLLWHPRHRHLLHRHCSRALCQNSWAMPQMRARVCWRLTAP